MLFKVVEVVIVNDVVGIVLARTWFAQTISTVDRERVILHLFVQFALCALIEDALYIIIPYTEAGNVSFDISILIADGI